MYWFGGVSLTAGFCEEFLYRGSEQAAAGPASGRAQPHMQAMGG